MLSYSLTLRGSLDECVVDSGFRLTFSCTEKVAINVPALRWESSWSYLNSALWTTTLLSEHFLLLFSSLSVSIADCWQGFLPGIGGLRAPCPGCLPSNCFQPSVLVAFLDCHVFVTELSLFLTLFLACSSTLFLAFLLSIP